MAPEGLSHTRSLALHYPSLSCLVVFFIFPIFLSFHFVWFDLSLIWFTYPPIYTSIGIRAKAFFSDPHHTQIHPTSQNIKTPKKQHPVLKTSEDARSPVPSSTTVLYLQQLHPQTRTYTRPCVSPVPTTHDRACLPVRNSTTVPILFSAFSQVEA